MFNTVVVLRKEKLSYGICYAWKVFNDSERLAQDSTSFSIQLTIARFYSIYLKKSHFVEVLFYPKNDVVAFPKIEINEIESAMSMCNLERLPKRMSGQFERTQ